VIWLIGNNGMLGSDVEHILSQRGFNYCATDQEVDITDMACLDSFLSENRIGSINYIINCAAYTAVDLAEKESEKAFKLNAEGPGNLAKIAQKRGSALIHISTDYVFDGEKEAPYIEDDPPHPLGVYGKSKLEGEKHVQMAIERHFILRTAWLYGKNGKNFVQTIIKRLKERDELNIVNDQTGNPTCTKDLANVIMTIIERSLCDYGIYHVTNEGQTTWYGFAEEIYRYIKKKGIITHDKTILPIASSEYQTPAKRPKNSSLGKEKLKTQLGITLRPWQEALYEYLSSENW
jgi:dTDP-4-dehydrorhamnose reductase